MSLKSYIVRQFAHPHGAIGWLAGHIMARRTSNRIRNAQTVALMDLQPDHQVLEVGCGPGLALQQAAETVISGHVVGLDHSPIMIRQSERRLRATGLSGRTETVVGGVEKLKDWENRFDRIYSLNVVQFLPDKAEFVRLAWNSLVAGGGLYTTYQPRLESDHAAIANQMANSIETLMSDAGFESIERSELVAGGAQVFCVSGFKR